VFQGANTKDCITYTMEHKKKQIGNAFGMTVFNNSKETNKINTVYCKEDSRGF